MLVRVGDLRGTGESGPAAAALAEMRCIASQGVAWVTRTSVLVAVVAFALALPAGRGVEKASVQRAMR
jgi:hypothetical protein